MTARELGSHYLSVITLGEMEKGLTTMTDVQRRQRLEAWLELQLIDLFLGRILPVTLAIAKRWEVFEGQRQIAGRPLSVRDGLIAATAFEHGLSVGYAESPGF